MNEEINHEGIYRTALASPDLLFMITQIISTQIVKKSTYEKLKLGHNLKKGKTKIGGKINLRQNSNCD